MASHSPETLLSNCILLVILAIFGFNKDICLITVVLFSIVGVTFLIFLHWEAMLIPGKAEHCFAIHWCAKLVGGIRHSNCCKHTHNTGKVLINQVQLALILGFPRIFLSWWFSTLKKSGYGKSLEGKVGTQSEEIWNWNWLWWEVSEQFCCSLR